MNKNINKSKINNRLDTSKLTLKLDNGIKNQYSGKLRTTTGVSNNNTNGMRAAGLAKYKKYGLRKNINSNDNSSKTSSENSRIRTQKDDNLNIKRCILKPKNNNKLNAGRVGITDKLRSEDNTSNLVANTIYHSDIYTKRTVKAIKTTVNGSIQTAKVLKSGKLKIKRLINSEEPLKLKLRQARIGAVNTIKGLNKIRKESVKETVKGIYGHLESRDSTTDLTINSLYSNVDYARRGVNATKKTINVVKTARNIKTGIQTKVKTEIRLHNYRKGIITQNKTKIVNNNKQKIFTNANLRKIGKKKLEKEKAKNIVLEKAKKIIKEVADGVNKIVSAVLKNPKVALIVGVIILFLILLISILSGVAGVGSITTVTPNINDSKQWIEKMNKIDAAANSKINSADEFKLENREVQASWKDVITVYMAKYYNSPPDLNDTSSSTIGDVLLGNSGKETTFTGTYADLIKIASEKYNIDANLIAAVIRQESNFDPNCVSSAGAMGLMQLMPETATSCGVDNAFDSYQNIMGGTKLLQELCEYYNNDLPMVLMGYNLGQGAMQSRGINSAEDLYKAPAETQAYVPIVMGNYEAYKNGTQLPDSTITGVVTTSGVSGDLAKIYDLFNTLSSSTRTETKSHTNSDGTTSKSTKIIKIVTLTKHDINYVMKELHFKQDQIELAKAMLQADLFKEVIPNFDFRFKIPGGNNIGGNAVIGSKGSIGSGNSLSDSTFSTVKSYIDRCIGTPYLMGGSDPASGYLDCSGFVSWVYTQAGVINNRYTAQGLCDISKPINEGDLKPGDLIFFQDTYNCGDTVTHIGIYVGNGMMAHSGNPCQYASYKTSYWQQHFYGYGRLT